MHVHQPPTHDLVAMGVDTLGLKHRQFKESDSHQSGATPSFDAKRLVD